MTMLLIPMDECQGNTKRAKSREYEELDDYSMNGEREVAMPSETMENVLPETTEAITSETTETGTTEELGQLQMDEWGNEIYTGKGPSPEEKWNERYNQWKKETRPVQEQKKRRKQSGFHKD